MLLRVAADSRDIAAEHPISETAIILDADAAVGDGAVGLGEMLPPRRVVEENALAVREREFHLAHRIFAIGPLAQVDFLGSGSDRLPVHRGGRQDRRILAEIGNDLIAFRLEIGLALPGGVRRHRRANKMRRHMPIGIGDGVMHAAGDDRRRQAQLVLVADDHLHRADRLASSRTCAAAARPS